MNARVDDLPAISFGTDWSASLRRTSEAELKDWLAFAIECADGADAAAMAGFRSETDVDRKPDGTLVTPTDRTIEDAVRNRIADRYPTHGVVGEELGEEDPDASIRWYLDPIDGTHNYIRGIPLFGFLLAVECDRELQAGVASAPALGMRWYAWRGGGAWALNLQSPVPARRLHVSHVTSMADATVLFRSVVDMHASRVAAGFDRLLGEVWKERGFGDFWGYALVADGAAEAMMEQQLGPWDLAAPWVIVEEAGGALTDFDGNRNVRRGEGLGTNGVLHAEILARLRRDS